MGLFRIVSAPNLDGIFSCLAALSIRTPQIRRCIMTAINIRFVLENQRILRQPKPLTIEVKVYQMYLLFQELNVLSREGERGNTHLN